MVSVEPVTIRGSVEVADRTGPRLECPRDISVEGGPNGAAVEWNVTAADVCGQTVTPVEVVCEPPSGSLFPPGRTTVTCVAFDDAGNRSECRFDVIVSLPGGQDRFRRADANADGRVDISDVVSTLNVLFAGSDPGPCPDAADANDDDRVDISDPVTTLNYLFGGLVVPPAPGPDECGPDPTASNLGDCSYVCDGNGG